MGEEQGREPIHQQRIEDMHANVEQMISKNVFAAQCVIPGQRQKPHPALGDIGIAPQILNLDHTFDRIIICKIKNVIELKRGLERVGIQREPQPTQQDNGKDFQIFFRIHKTARYGFRHAAFLNSPSRRLGSEARKWISLL